MAKTSKRKKGLRVFIIVVIVLVAIRVALPYVVLRLTNNTLANMNGYYGHIEDIDIALYRGAYKVKKMYLNKVDSITGEQTEFIKAELTDLSIEWPALFQGSLVGEIRVEKPEIRFTKEKVEPQEVIKDSSDFRKAFKNFMPLDVNKLTVHSGKLRYVDESSSPNVDIALTEMELTARNLTNSSEETDVLPSPIKLDASLYKGHFNVDMRINLLAQNPTFDLTSELKNTDLTELNEFFSAYADFDVNKGSFGLYTEFAAKDGKFKGYVKPFLKDLDVRGEEDKNDPWLRKTWESIVGTAGDILQNQKEDQVATKVPIEGSFSDPKPNILQAILQLLKNAFIEALMPSVDQQINIDSVDSDFKTKDMKEKEEKGFFKKIFGGEKKKDKGENK